MESSYKQAIKPHILWFKEQIEKSKDGIIRLRLKDIAKEMGNEFVNKHDMTIYSRLKDILLENGIKIVMEHIDNDSKDKVLKMEFAKEDEIVDTARIRYERSIICAERKGLTTVELTNEYNYATRYIGSELENKSCPLYFGNYIEKKYVSQIFEDSVPFTFPKDDIGRIMDKHKPYDFICKKGPKIKHVASCIRRKNYSAHFSSDVSEIEYWAWLIGRNPIPDYWILSAWNNRESLEPMFVWMIKGNESFNTQRTKRPFYDRETFTVYYNEKGIRKMFDYEIADKTEKLKEVCRLTKKE